MSSRPALTLILLTSTHMQRVDVASDGALQAPGDWLRDRPPGTDLADHAELTLRLGGAPGKQLWVLASELWTQTASLPAGAARASSPSELQSALALEVEALSGLPSQGAQVALRPLGEAEGRASYWVTLAPDYLLEELREAASRAGTKLAGVCHPGGLPRSLNGAGGAWERLELWDEALFDLRTREGSFELEIEPGGTMGHLPPAEPGATQEVLIAAAGGAAPEGAEGATTLELEAPEARSRWLRAWGEVLLQDSSAVPVLNPPRKPLTRSGKLLIGLGLFCATVLACAGHYGWAQREIQHLEQRLTAAAAPAQAAAKIDQKLTRLTQELETTKRETARLAQIEDRYRKLTRAHRGRHAKLLRALAAAPEEVFLESLEDRGRTLTVGGLAADPQVALGLATSLARDLRGTSWRVGAPHVSAEGGGWRFTLELTDQVPPPAPRRGTR